MFLNFSSYIVNIRYPEKFLPFFHIKNMNLFIKIWIFIAFSPTVEQLINTVFTKILCCTAKKSWYFFFHITFIIVIIPYIQLSKFKNKWKSVGERFDKYGEWILLFKFHLKSHLCRVMSGILLKKQNFLPVYQCWLTFFRNFFQTLSNLSQ